MPNYLDANRSRLRQPAWGQLYRGTPLLKNPCDLWAECQIMDECKPKLIIECGTYLGGSAAYYADRVRYYAGHVLSIDLNVKKWQQSAKVQFGDISLPHRDNLSYQIGQSSVDLELLEYVQSRAEVVESVMVVLDSSHLYKHVIQELHAYAPLVTKGQYLIVEDVFLDPTDGPERAIKEFFPARPEWQHMPKWEDMFGPDLTYNKLGFWRKK